MSPVEIERVLAMHRIYAGEPTEGFVRALQAAATEQQRLRGLRAVA